MKDLNTVINDFLHVIVNLNKNLHHRIGPPRQIFLL